MTVTCFIRYEIEPYAREDFAQYARNWGKVIPRCGAGLIGYFAPHEGSATTAYGVYNIASLADYEVYRGRLLADPLGQENYAFAKRGKFIRSEDRIFPPARRYRFLILHVFIPKPLHTCGRYTLGEHR